MPAPTIRDVAREAGVGVGTVSRVLSGGARVAPETRRRVEAAIERLDYRPSAAARALSRRRTQTIEVLVPMIVRHFYVEILRGVELGLAETDYTLIVRAVERAADRDRVFDDIRQRGRSDGLLIFALAPTEALLAHLDRARLPAVLVDCEHPALPSVSVDHRAAIRLAVRHLVDLGHQRIALVDRHQDPFTPLDPSARQQGYREVLLEAKLTLRAEYEHITEFTPEAAGAALCRLLDLAERPTGLCTGSDAQAIGVLEAARRRGHRVPEDLAVVGYSDIEFAEYLGLTTVRLPVQEMGRRGLEFLLAEIETRGSAPRLLTLPAELVVRRTTAAPSPAPP